MAPSPQVPPANEYGSRIQVADISKDTATLPDSDAGPLFLSPEAADEEEFSEGVREEVCAEWDGDRLDWNNVLFLRDACWYLEFHQSICDGDTGRLHEIIKVRATSIINAFAYLAL